MPSETIEQAPPTHVLSTIPPAARPTPVAQDLEIIEHVPLGGHHMRLVLEAPAIAHVALPGQFVMLSMAVVGAASPTLPRPMAIYAIDGTRIEIVYGVVGDGTRHLASLPAGSLLHVVGPLGQPFVLGSGTARVLLVGRGIGTCSLTTVAQHLPAGTVLDAVTSARTRELLIGGDLYRAHGAGRVYEVTDAAGDSDVDSIAARLRADLAASPPDVIMTCGSNRLVAMCHELAREWGSEVQVSIEAHMACGLGYCHGCASGRRAEGDESPLVCRDGPVFRLQSAAGA